MPSREGSSPQEVDCSLFPLLCPRAQVPLFLSPPSSHRIPTIFKYLPALPRAECRIIWLLFLLTARRNSRPSFPPLLSFLFLNQRLSFLSLSPRNPARNRNLLSNPSALVSVSRFRISGPKYERSNGWPRHTSLLPL